MVDSAPVSELFAPLPVALTSFVGRDEDMRSICACLMRPEVRLLTLTGVGGVGKTRLAIAVARDMAQNYRHGVCFVSLAAVHDETLVMPALAQALHLQITTSSLFETVHMYLREKQVLLVLDNFEQVLSSATQLVDLLALCPHLTLLVTSRELLHVKEEHEYTVLPLAVPSPVEGGLIDRHTIDTDAIAHNASIMLFVQRARMHKPSFMLTAQNVSTIVDICTRLDGLPLALELAAARIKILPPAMLLVRLDHRFAILTNGTPDMEPRHQTLFHTIQWSYDLLTHKEQHLFRRVCIFVGGFTLEAVEKLSQLLGEDAAGVLESVSSLFDKSLLARGEQDQQENTFTVLETIRAFGLECLQACGEREQVQQTHARYYLQWAEQNRRKAFGHDQQALIERYVREQWNWRAAMQFFLQENDAESALKLAGGLSIFWLIWGYSYNQFYLREGTRFLAHALKETANEISSARAWALGVYGGLLSMLRDERSELVCREGLALARQLQDRQYVITGLWMLLLPLLMKDDFITAHEAITEALLLVQEPGATFPAWGKAWLQGYSFHRAGYIALWQGRYAESREWLIKTIHICEQEDEQFFSLWSHLFLGEVAFFEDRHDEARVLLEGSAAHYRAMGIRTQVAEALGFLGLLSLRAGKLDEAHTYFTESLRLRHEVGDEQGIAWAEIWFARLVRVQHNENEAHAIAKRGLLRAINAHSRLLTAMGLEELATIAAIADEAPWATRLFGTADRLRQEMGIPQPVIDRQQYEACVSSLHTTLGTATFQSLFDEGRNTTASEVLSKPHETSSSTPPPNSSSEPLTASPPTLTKREMEVLRLLAQGLTNTQIAEQLNLSSFTVHAHLRTIYAKLDVYSRTQAVHIALTHNLL